MVQAIFVYTGVFMGSEEMLAPGVEPGFSLFLRVLLGLTAGAVFVMWLGELITEHGIGNGASLIIMANIIASMPASIAAMKGNDEFYTSMVSLMFLWIVIVVAIVGNAAEHWVAVLVAVKDKMDLSVNIAIGSSAQVALFVAPVLVLCSFFLGPGPMPLVFNGFEIAAVVIGVLVAYQVTNEGESNWFEGVQLLALYAILGLTFFYA